LRTNFSKTRKAATLMLVVSCVSLAMPIAAMAVSAQYVEGVRLYGAGQYSQAANKLSEAARQEPTNPSIHYYLGLCYQNMNQMALAKQEYDWVARAGSDARLRYQATVALSNLARYRGGATSQSATTSNASRMIASAPSSDKARRLKVVEYYTDW
jgi:tetratricopeptide (TPR) repeat protein